MKPDSLVLSTILWFHHRAFQDIYRMRDDVTVIGMSDLLRPEWFNPVTPKRFPNLAVPPDPFDRPEQGEYLKRFLAANLDQGRDIYWEPFDLDRGCFYPNLKPELELLFKVTRKPIKKLPEVEVGAGHRANQIQAGAGNQGRRFPGRRRTACLLCDSVDADGRLL